MTGEALGRPVLVIEDDLDLLEMMQAVLEAASYQVVLAPNGQEAVAAVEKEMPGLILLDMKMPIMNGWEFAAWFKARYTSPDTPIVVVTAAADARERAIEIGAQAYLNKPFDIDELIRCVARHYRPYANRN